MLGARSVALVGAKYDGENEMGALGVSLIEEISNKSLKVLFWRISYNGRTSTSRDISCEGRRGGAAALFSI